MLRLFTGISLPTELTLQLQFLRADIPDARWVDPENYHLTLVFAGEIEAPQADDFVRALDEIRQPAFSLQLQGVGSFGSRRPHAIWAGFAPSPALAQLQRDHQLAGRAAGIEPEHREYTPHVTLARLRGRRSAECARFLAQHHDFSRPPFVVDAFHLFSARPGGGGPYVIEESFGLQQGAPSDFPGA